MANGMMLARMRVLTLISGLNLCSSQWALQSGAHAAGRSVW